jgi:hypothetical protein
MRNPDRANKTLSMIWEIARVFGLSLLTVITFRTQHSGRTGSGAIPARCI